MPDFTLLERLRESELFSAKQLAELEALPQANNPDPKVLACIFVQRGYKNGPEGKSVPKDLTVRAWDMQKRNEIGQVSLAEMPRSLAISPSGSGH